MKINNLSRMFSNPINRFGDPPCQDHLAVQSAGINVNV